MHGGDCLGDFVATDFYLDGASRGYAVDTLERIFGMDEDGNVFLEPLICGGISVPRPREIRNGSLTHVCKVGLD